MDIDDDGIEPGAHQFIAEDGDLKGNKVNFILSERQHGSSEINIAEEEELEQTSNFQIGHVEMNNSESTRSGIKNTVSYMKDVIERKKSDTEKSSMIIEGAVQEDVIVSVKKLLKHQVQMDQSDHQITCAMSDETAGASINDLEGPFGVSEEEFAKICDIDEDDVDESAKGNAEDTEYLFPTPEEIENAEAPAVGMSFSSVNEAHRFINVYGLLKGFAVFKGRNYKNRKTLFQCNKSKKPKENENPVKKRKRRKLERTSCQMRVAVALQNGRWTITAVKLEHNHDLVPTPSLTKFFMNHRFMSDDEITLSKILQEIRIKPRKIMAIFRKLRGRFSNLFFDKTKIKNIKQADKKIVENTDIDKTMVFVKKLQLEQPGFFYTMRTTSDNRVRSIFWTDTKSRLNYSLYGDFISFDTTYSTNKYNMPFAPIVGIDGHGKNIVFGWALLENQTADTFSWLFNAFLEVMGGKKPSIIMTDQDAAMKKSIDEIFPDEFHRNCFWHVMRNAREKLAAFISTRKEEGMGSVLYNLVTQSVTEEEFEEGWAEMLRKYDASENTYLKQMYNTRKMWVPVFFKKVFCPFIWSTGRSESTNSNFKDYVMRKDTIETFLRQYEIFQEEQIEIENRERYESSVLVPVYSTMQPIERHAGAIYTRGMFLKFQLELYNSSVFSVEELEKNAKYEVVKVMDYKEPEFNRRSFVVEVDRSTNKFDCVCAKYDRDGILCCHVLRLFQQLGIHQIPETYINKRWTAQYKEAEMKKQKEISVQQTGTDSSQCALRYALMMNRISDMCSAMSRTTEKSKEFMDSVEEVFNKMNAKNDQQPNREVETQYKDPLVSTAKSVNKGSRLMRASEKKKGKRNGGNGRKSKALPQQPSNDAA